jgi:hypothetical protein
LASRSLCAGARPDRPPPPTAAPASTSGSIDVSGRRLRWRNSEALVRHDAGEPRIERLSQLEPPDRVPGPNERLLRKVVRVARVAGERPRQPVDRPLVAAHQLAERLLVAFLARGEQRGVVRPGFRGTHGGRIHSRQGTARGLERQAFRLEGLSRRLGDVHSKLLTRTVVEPQSRPQGIPGGACSGQLLAAPVNAVWWAADESVRVAAGRWDPSSTGCGSPPRGVPDGHAVRVHRLVATWASPAVLALALSDDRLHLRRFVRVPLHRHPRARTSLLLASTAPIFPPRWRGAPAQRRGRCAARDGADASGTAFVFTGPGPAPPGHAGAGSRWGSSRATGR